VPLLQDVAANAVTGGGQFDFSSTGTLVYAAGKSAAQAWQVVWMDSAGKTEPLLAGRHFVRTRVAFLQVN